MDDLVAVASRLVTAHPAVTGAEFAGSRSRGEHHELSDWDVAAQTSDFAAVARDMHALVARRDALEREYGISVPRALEDEIRAYSGR